MSSKSSAFGRSNRMNHSPPPNRLPVKKGSCCLCTMPDNNDMVQCDRCNLWYHFTCVNVTQAIENVDWQCDTCKDAQAGASQLCVPQILIGQEQPRDEHGDVDQLKKASAPNKPLDSKGPPSCVGSTGKQNSLASRCSAYRLELEKLEEERALKKREREIRAKEDEEYLRKKYEILQGLEDSKSVTSRSSATRSRTASWVANTNSNQRENDAENEQNDNLMKDSTLTKIKAKENLEGVPVSKSDTQQVTMPAVVPPCQPNTSQQYAQLWTHHQHQQYQQPPQPHQQNTLPPQSTQPLLHAMPLTQSTDPRYTQASQYLPTSNVTSPNFVSFAPNTSLLFNAHQQPSRMPYYHFASTQSQQPQNTSLPVRNATEIDPILSSRQVAARHVMAKDLPIFNGNPEEWPMFISSFESSTRVCGYSQDENLARLQRSLKGRALDAVRSRLLLPTSVPNVMQTLRTLYGRPELIIQTLLTKIRGEPSPKADKLETVINFGLAVQNLTDTMIASGQTDHLADPTLLQELVDKLPPQIKLQWALYKRSLPATSLSIFSEWISNIAMAISEVTIPNPSSSQTQRQPKGYLHQHTETENTLDETEAEEQRSQFTDQNKTRFCQMCNSSQHRIGDCSQFKNITRNEKFRLIRAKSLCRQCLNNHGRWKCRQQQACGIEGCQLQHHPLLHQESTPQEQGKIVNSANCNSHRQSKTMSVLFRVVPVTLHGENTSLDTFALLDEGSSITLLEKTLADELNLIGPADTLCLRWTSNAVRTEENSKLVSFKISGSDRQNKHSVNNARTVESLNLPTQSNDMINKFAHLSKIPITLYNNAKPRLLIGIDNWHLGLPLKYKEGGLDEPVGTKTRLGWIVHGRFGKPKATSSSSDQYLGFHSCDCMENNVLHELVKGFFSIESCGVLQPQTLPQSNDDQRARHMLEATTNKINHSRYESGLLWRYDKIEFPDSLPMATRRLICLEKKMSKNQTLAENLKKQIRDYQTKGYAHKVTAEEFASFDPLRIWYLPIFAVSNVHKPNKIRIVWDAAAKVEGISLNTMLLKGPDQLTSLLNVLYRFRQRKVAICGDIQEMFHQVKIRPADRQSQLFLWRDDPSKDPDIYAMDVMTFGSTCSPCSAQFVKNTNARCYENKYPRAAQAICENHYVDDYLDSTDTADEAAKLAMEVKLVHSMAGFNMRNWMSNSATVRKNLGATKETSKKNLLPTEPCENEKVLGMWWCPLTDYFTYCIASNKVIGERKPTKREVLRILMTIFDPLGLIACFLVHVKVLLQDIWRSAIDWDQEITDAHFEKWRTWTSLLPSLETLQIPRCYLGQQPSASYKSLQVHVFVDASEEAYAAAAYFRICNGVEVNCELVSAKTKVAPLRPLSIPRMELQAALLGARLINTVCNGHSLKVKQQYLWSDSRTVLSWLRSDQRKYGQFVAFRVGEILETTQLENWRWVPTRHNVADEATKWTGFSISSHECRWFKGPEFLYKSEDEWPTQPNYHIETEEELRPHLLLHQAIDIMQPLIDVKRFSNWNRLLRTQAYVYRFINNVKAKIQKLHAQSGPFTQTELVYSERELWRAAQRQGYPAEVAILNNTKSAEESKTSLHKGSPLYKESPYIDENGVIRMKGRIDKSSADISAKRPILLPKDSRITLLIIDHFHRSFHHHNNETVVNEIRQKFRIPNLRALVKRVIKSCQRCKNFHSRPVPPMMADLPSARLASFIKPFTYVGIDFFGPIMVTVHRRSEKRWGVLFTCLTIRAVHIEVAYSLGTDSCIICIQNFIARRGHPAEIYSDNGTNFHGACNELKRQQSENEALAVRFTTADTKWIFNPPSSPHMGGCWERLIRSIKTSLEQITTSRTLNDEILRGTLMEAEMMVNSRPLTYIPLDSTNDEALTPNHFLLGSSQGLKEVPRPPTEEKTTLRCHWRRAQFLADQFWHRWVQEYLPTITRRTKWFENTKNIENGDVVVIVDPASPRNSWPRGRVLDAVAGKDGIVRHAVVQTSSGITRKPTIKLARLDVKRRSQSESADNNKSTNSDAVLQI